MKKISFKIQAALMTAAILLSLISFTSCEKKENGKTINIIGQDCFVDNSELRYFTDAEKINTQGYDEEIYDFGDRLINKTVLRHYTIKDVVYSEDDVPFFYLNGPFGEENKSVYVQARDVCFTYTQIKSFIPAYFAGNKWAFQTLYDCRFYLTNEDGDFDSPQMFHGNSYAIVGLLVDYYENHRTKENLEKINDALDIIRLNSVPESSIPLANPICMAINAGDTEVAKKIISNSVSKVCSAVSPIDGHTPAIAAVLNGNKEVIEALMERQINISVQDSNGKTFYDYIEASNNPELQKFNVPSFAREEWRQIAGQLIDYYSGEDFACPVTDMEVAAFRDLNKKRILLPGACIMKKDGSQIIDSYVDDIFVLDYDKQYKVSPNGIRDYCLLCKSETLGEFVVLAQYVAVYGDFDDRTNGSGEKNVYRVTFESTESSYIIWEKMIYVDRSRNLFKPLSDDGNYFIETGNILYNYSKFITEYNGDTVIIFISSFGIPMEDETINTAYILPLEENTKLNFIGQMEYPVSSMTIGFSEEDNELIASYAFYEEYRYQVARDYDFESVGAGVQQFYYYNSEEKTFEHEYEKDEQIIIAEW